MFATDRWRADGHRTICADCGRDYDRERDYIRRCVKYGLQPVVEPFSTAQLVARYGGRCTYCGTGSFRGLDHFLCVAVGGHHTLENARPCCARCNRRKRWTVDEPLIREFRRSQRSEASL